MGGAFRIQNVLSAFSNLQGLNIHLRPYTYPSHIDSQDILSIKGTHPNLKSLKISGRSVQLKASTLKNRFPNLVKLIILTPQILAETLSRELDENWLQTIIQNLRKLKVLKVSLFSNSDFGVSGIDDEMGQKLVESKDLYLRRCVKVPSRGVPLSSLKRKY